jgi:hypothetical protein
MAWTIPDSAFLKLRMAADFASLARAAQGAGVVFADVVAGVIADNVSLVRGYVSANPNNALGAEGSLPPEAQAPFVTLCRLALIATIPGGSTLGDDLRRSMEKRAMETLDSIAAGRIRITPAEDAAAAQPETATGVSGGDAGLDWGDEETTNGL